MGIYKEIIMERKKAKALATHIIEYQSAKHKLQDRYEDYEIRKLNAVNELTEAVEYYNFPNEEHETIIPYLSDWVRQEVLLSFVGKTLVLFDPMKFECETWCFGAAPEGYYNMYPKVISVRTESFGKKEDSVVYMLTLEWGGNEFDYMCSTFSQLLSLKIKEEDEAKPS